MTLRRRDTNPRVLVSFRQDDAITMIEAKLDVHTYARSVALARCAARIGTVKCTGVSEGEGARTLTLPRLRRIGTRDAE
jgi:hypothetical protein